MNIQDYSSLPKNLRRFVKVARQANYDTIYGGCLASTQAKTYEEIVQAIYAYSLGRVPDHLDAFECQECGEGRQEAYQCCLPEYDLILIKNHKLNFSPFLQEGQMVILFLSSSSLRKSDLGNWPFLRFGQATFKLNPPIPNFSTKKTGRGTGCTNLLYAGVS